MNPKIEKINIEIEKVEKRIANDKTRLRELNAQKKELENMEILAMVRKLGVGIGDLADFEKKFKEQTRQGNALPNLTADNNGEFENGGKD